MNVQQLHDVFLYIEPWLVRRCLSVNHEWNNALNRLLPFLDRYYLNETKRQDIRHCHSEFYMRLPYDYSIIVPHDCTISDCSVPCHRNNNFGSAHWDITRIPYKPMKCVQCGEVFISYNTVRNIFFLRDSEIKNAWRYSAHLHGRNRVFNKREIQWYSLMVHETTEPYYRKSIRRLKRERTIQRMMSSLDIRAPFTQESILATTPFRMYREGRLQIRLSILYNRMVKFLPVFYEFYSEWVNYDRTINYFSDMTGLFVYSHGFNMELLKSLSWYLGQSVYFDNLDHGLIQARLFILNMYRCKPSSVLSNLSASYMSEHPELTDAVDRFTNGTFSIQELIDLLQSFMKRDERSRYIRYLIHTKGIHQESFPSCVAFNNYVEHSSVSSNIVVMCMRNHVNGTKNCLTNDNN